MSKKSKYAPDFPDFGPNVIVRNKIYNNSDYGMDVFNTGGLGVDSRDLFMINWKITI